MTTKILSVFAAGFFIILTFYAGAFAISNIGNINTERTVFALTVFLTVAILSVFSSYFAVCKFRKTCDTL